MAQRNAFVNVVLGVLDTALLVAGYRAALTLRFHHGVPFFNLQAYQGTVWWIAGAAAIVLIGLGFYGPNIPTRKGLLRSAAVGSVLMGLGTAAAAFWNRSFAFPRSVVVLGTMLGWVAVLGWRLLLLTLQRQRRRRTAVLGTPDEVTTLTRLLEALPACGFQAVLPVTPSPEATAEELGLADVEALILAPSVDANFKARLAAWCAKHGKTLLVVPTIYELMLFRSRPLYVAHLPLLELPQPRLPSSQRLVKRLFDVLCSAVLLALSAPVLGLCALAILLDDGPPCIYRQERVGVDGRVFTMYKLRTMVRNAEAQTGPSLATRYDPRVTRVGRVLRHLRLDELPQLFNVLRGDMSLVGPRPERPAFVTHLEREIEHYAQRHFVPPGLTGLAQVAGSYATAPEDKLRLDLLYVFQYSLLRDLQLLMQTVTAVLSPEAAAGVPQDGPARPGSGR